jgi:hypothetical protein
MKLDNMWVRDAANEDSADLMRCISIANAIVVFGLFEFLCICEAWGFTCALCNCDMGGCV